jgi:hypothetical protein
MEQKILLAKGISTETRPHQDPLDNPSIGFLFAKKTTSPINKRRNTVLLFKRHNPDPTAYGTSPYQGEDRRGQSVADI